MGCFASKPEQPERQPSSGRGRNGSTSLHNNTQHRVHHFAKPKWKSPEPMTQAKLDAMREQFWFTEPAYGGDKVIWDALKAVCEERDIKTARAIIDSAGIIVAAENLTVCYDTRGVKYELPMYVLSAPTNLVKGGDKAPSAPGGQQAVSLTAGMSSS